MDQLSLIPIEQEVCRGVMSMLAEVFGVPEERQLFYSDSTTKALDAYRTRLAAEKKSLTYPIMFVRLTGMTREPQQLPGNQRTLMRRGVYLQADETNSQVLKGHMARADYTFDVQFLTDDMLKSLWFASTWLAVGLSGKLNFGIQYYSVAIDIPVELAPEVTIPEKETSVDTALSVYEYATTLNAKGWIVSQHRDHRLNVPVVKNVQVGLSDTLREST